MCKVRPSLVALAFLLVAAVTTAVGQAPAKEVKKDKLDKILERLDDTDKKIDTMFVKLQADIKGLRADVDFLKAQRIVVSAVPPKQAPNPKVASVRIENETGEAVKVRVNESVVEVGAKQTRFVSIPAGQFTYQVLGVHAKAIMSELSDGQVYGLAVREKTQLAQEKKDEIKPKPADKVVKLPEPAAKEAKILLYNKHTERLPFRVNGVNHYVSPGRQMTVTIPAGRCTITFPGWSSNIWNYDAEDGMTYRCGAITRIEAPSYYYVPMSCGSWR